MTPGEFFEEPLGGPGFRGGQSEGNLSLPLKVPLSAPLPLWYGPRPERSAEEAEDPTGRVLSGNWDMYPLSSVRARRGIDSDLMKPAAAACRALSMMRSSCSG